MQEIRLYIKLLPTFLKILNMLKDFLAMVAQGEQTFDLLKALEVFQICCAQEESVRTGRPVRLG